MTRPRPRPRPRPVQRSSTEPNGTGTCGDGGNGASTSTCPTLGSINGGGKATVKGSATVDVKDQDLDKMFMRNTKRTNKSWKRLAKRDAAAQALQPVNDESSGSSDNDQLTEAGGLQRQRKKYKSKSKGDDGVKPLWEKDKNTIRDLSKDLDSSSDGIEIIGQITPNRSPSKKRKRPGTHGHSRSRSRSRSITPPPAIPQHLLENTRNVVRQALATVPLTPSFQLYDPGPDTNPDDSTDTIILDPELAQIAATVKYQSQSHASLASSSYSSLASQSSSEMVPGSSQQPNDRSRAGTIIIRVHWIPHPLNEAGRKDIWGFKMNRDDSFRELFDEVADLASILANNLIVCYQNKRIYPSSKPMSLSMLFEEELDACDKVTYEYLQQQKAKQHIQVPPLQPSNIISLDDDGDEIEITSPDSGLPPSSALTNHGATFHPTSNSDSDNESTTSTSDTFKLVLRSSAYPADITLTVRPSTTCGAIVKAYLRKAGLAERYPGAGEVGKAISRGKGKGKDPRISVDGDKMDNGSEIREADLDDGDMVEVVGL